MAITIDFPSGGSGLPLTGGTLTGQLIQSTNGAASTPPLLLSGTAFTGGSATTTKPSLLVEPTGTTSNNWSTSGTLLGANAPSGFTGSVISGQVNAVSVFDAKSSVVTMFASSTKVEFYPSGNSLYIKTNVGDTLQISNVRLKFCQWGGANYYLQSPDAGNGTTNRSTGNLNIHSGIA